MNTRQKTRIGWLCLSGVSKSESFLSNTLEQLLKVGEVLAISGVSNGARMGCQNHRYIPFNEHRLTIWHTLFQRLTRRNLHRLQVQGRCLRMTRSTWVKYNPEVFWIEFGTTAVIAKDLLKSQDIHYVISVHGYDISTAFKDEDYRKEFVEIANHPNCRAIVCASHHTKRLCVLAGVELEKCRVIRLGMNGDVIKRDQTIEKTEHASFVHFGRLTEKKHPIATLEAFKMVATELPEASLTFIGDGPLKQELLSRIEESHLTNRVRCIEAMEQSLALQEVQRHWVFVQHSVTSLSGDQEGFALSPAEAALLEMPVVSTLHNGIPEHITDGVTGFLVNEFDFEAMAKRMITLAKDDGLRERMGVAGRASTLALCDPSKRLTELDALLNGEQG